MNYRKGDLVSVGATVEYDFDENDASDKILFLKISGHYQSVGLTPDHFSKAKLKLLQAKFEVGEVVTWDRPGISGTILSFNEAWAWVQHETGPDRGVPTTIRLDALTRIDIDFSEVPEPRTAAGSLD